MFLTRIAVTGAVATALIAHPSTAVAAAAPLETLQIGTDGTATGTLMTWVCNTTPSRHCVDKAGPASRWTTTVTVPQGTMVWFQVENWPRETASEQPSCWISNLATGEMLAQSRSHCIYQGPRMPFDPAPPSDN